MKRVQRFDRHEPPVDPKEAKTWLRWLGRQYDLEQEAFNKSIGKKDEEYGDDDAEPVERKPDKKRTIWTRSSFPESEEDGVDTDDDGQEAAVVVNRPVKRKKRKRAPVINTPCKGRVPEWVRIGWLRQKHMQPIEERIQDVLGPKGLPLIEELQELNSDDCDWNEWRIRWLLRRSKKTIPHNMKRRLDYVRTCIKNEKDKQRRIEEVIRRAEQGHPVGPEDRGVLDLLGPEDWASLTPAEQKLVSVDGREIRRRTKMSPLEKWQARIGPQFDNLYDKLAKVIALGWPKQDSFGRVHGFMQTAMTKRRPAAWLKGVLRNLQQEARAKKQAARKKSVR